MTTRIADLPENITMQLPTTAFPIQQQQQQQQPHQGTATNVEGLGGNSYIPINVHPNPFGNNTPDITTMPFPQQQGQGQGQGQGGYAAPDQRLPSRDIPSNHLDYTNDPEIKPNYIPKATLTRDYIKEYEFNEEKVIREHEKKKHRKRVVDDIFTSLHTPLVITFLYFIFQMAIVTKTMYKTLQFLQIYHTDGNLNIYGMVFKSILFGAVFYGIHKMLDFLSSI
jgi:hypothetical protein